MSETVDPIVSRVIEAAGGHRALAEALGIKAPSIYNWQRIPPARVLEIERFTGIPRHVLRPDFYPDEPKVVVAIPIERGLPPPSDGA